MISCRVRVSSMHYYQYFLDKSSNTSTLAYESDEDSNYLPSLCTLIYQCVYAYMSKLIDISEMNLFKSHQNSCLTYSLFQYLSFIYYINNEIYLRTTHTNTYISYIQNYIFFFMIYCLILISFKCYSIFLREFHPQINVFFFLHYIKLRALQS